MNSNSRPFFLKLAAGLLGLIWLAGCAQAANPTAAVPPTIPPLPIETTGAGYPGPATTLPAAAADQATLPVAQAYPAGISTTPGEARPTQPANITPTASPVSTGNITPMPFDGEQAYQDVLTQVAMGPRIPGTQAHAQAVTWMKETLQENDWTVEVQDTTYRDQPVQNVIARRGSGSPWIILGAHYDSRMQATEDRNRPNDPVPAANDGASGVAVLLELARVLPKDQPGQVWLVLFDSEDQGGLPGWDWILGSRAFVDSLEGKPDAAVIIDMIGDAGLGIYKEQSSNQAITDEIWNVAARLGYDSAFIPEYRYNMLDDHTPFLENGIPAIDVIDFDYPYWHTTEDTPDKVSAKSLKTVGDTLFLWLEERTMPVR